MKTKTRAIQFSFEALRTALLYVGLILLSASHTYSQPNDRPQPPPPQHEDGFSGRGGGEDGEVPSPPGGGFGGRMKFRAELAKNLISPEMIMQHQAELNLTATQKTQLLDEMKKLYSAMPEIQMKLGEAQEKLSKQLEEKRINEESVLHAVDELGNIERDMKRQHLSVMIRLRNMLTDEQFEKLKQSRREQFGQRVQQGGFGRHLLGRHAGGQGSGERFREMRKER